LAAYFARTAVIDGIDVVQLGDATREMQVSIATSVGNIAYEFSVCGRNLLWFPYSGPAELRADPKLCGIPFLAPWANRLSGDTYSVNGNNYRLNPGLGYLRRDANQKPIHGLLLFSPLWKIISLDGGPESAFTASRLEFWRYPELMAQFPFAHEITISYRLAGGALEIRTLLTNLSAETMPVAIGFHPYFRLHDAPRDDWKVHIAARDHVELDQFLIPTGVRRVAGFVDPYPLSGNKLDDVFTDLIRGEDGIARFWVQGAQQRLTVAYGQNYRVAVVFAPAERDYVCFEPMAALTNAFNLAHDGRYTELQSIPPGSQWQESFWVEPKSS
jgi:aldose 1-epimerase